MLILERELGETVITGNGDDKLEVALQKDDKGRHKHCFDTPPQYKIFRKELEI